jgi:hypothetical protein
VRSASHGLHTDNPIFAAWTGHEANMQTLPLLSTWTQLPENTSLRFSALQSYQITYALHVHGVPRVHLCHTPYSSHARSF